MKKITALLLAAVLSVMLYACAKPGNIADTSLRSGETKITGTVEKVSGNSIVIHDGNGGRYSFTYSDEITVVEDQYYVVDYSADHFKGMEITVICSDRIMETYPAMLSDVRMIITE